MSLASLLRPLLAAALVSGLSACPCPPGEIDSVDACTRLTDAFTLALTRCQLATTPASSLCMASCGDACVEQSEIEACTLAIESIACGQLSLPAVELLDSCSEVLQAIAEQDCHAHDSHDDDDDDLFDD